MTIISPPLRRWAFVAILLLVGCYHQSSEARKPVVVVTNFPIANLVDQLAGDWMVVKMLPFHDTGTPGTHALDGADLLLVSGEAKDEGIESAGRAAGRRLEILRFSDLTGDHQSHPPHACPWLDPVLAEHFVAALGPHLQQRLPAELAAPLRNRVMLLRTDLMLIHQEFAARFADAPHRKLAAWDATFDDLTSRYGLEIAIHLTDPKLQSDPNDPSHFDALAARLQETGATDFCAPIGEDSQAIPEIARRAGVRLLRLDPGWKPGLEGRSRYQAIVRWDLETLLAAEMKK